MSKEQKQQIAENEQRGSALIEQYLKDHEESVVIEHVKCKTTSAEFETYVQDVVEADIKTTNNQYQCFADLQTGKIYTDRNLEWAQTEIITNIRQAFDLEYPDFCEVTIYAKDIEEENVFEDDVDFINLDDHYDCIVEMIYCQGKIDKGKIETQPLPFTGSYFVTIKEVLPGYRPEKENKNLILWELTAKPNGNNTQIIFK